MLFLKKYANIFPPFLAGKDLIYDEHMGKNSWLYTMIFEIIYSGHKAYENQFEIFEKIGFENAFEIRIKVSFRVLHNFVYHPFPKICLQYVLYRNTVVLHL